MHLSASIALAALFAVLFTEIVTARPFELADDFQGWQSVHDKVYENERELAYRQQVFQTNVEKIRASNELQQSFKVAVNCRQATQ